MLFILASVSFMLLDKRLFSDSILTKLKCSCEAVCFVLLTLESGEHDNGAFLPVISIFFFINLLKNSFIFAPDCIICLSLSCCHFLNASRLFLLSSWDFCRSMALFFFDSVRIFNRSWISFRLLFKYSFICLLFSFQNFIIVNCILLGSAAFSFSLTAISFT